MERDKVSQINDQKNVERNYQHYFGNQGNQKPTEIERQGYFIQYSAYSHLPVVYASNTGY